jgi:hypothetical protein
MDGEKKVDLKGKKRLSTVSLALALIGKRVLRMLSMNLTRGRRLRVSDCNRRAS